MNILFIDRTCPAPYARNTLFTQGLGGTEASMIRVGEALGKKHDVVVMQHLRKIDCVGESNVAYIAASHRDDYDVARNPDVVVVEKYLDQIEKVRADYPGARLFLWLHPLPQPEDRNYLESALRTETTLVAVSEFQKTRQIERFLGVEPYGQIDLSVHQPLPPIEVIAEPIEDDLLPDQTAVNPDKLVFFSSPHKGLDQVLRAFQAVRRRRRSVHLFLANPGYIPDSAGAADVTVLGSLPQHEAIKHVREAFCVFYPQSRFEETFGLVFAEANAVGTPVMTHPIGSAPEVLSSPEQLVDSSDPEHVADELMRWYEEGRPTVRGRDDYRLSNVIRRWERLFDR